VRRKTKKARKIREKKWGRRSLNNKGRWQKKKRKQNVRKK